MVTLNVRRYISLLFSCIIIGGCSSGKTLYPFDGLPLSYVMPPMEWRYLNKLDPRFVENERKAYKELLTDIASRGFFVNDQSGASNDHSFSMIDLEKKLGYIFIWCLFQKINFEGQGGGKIKILKGEAFNDFIKPWLYKPLWKFPDGHSYDLFYLSCVHESLRNKNNASPRLTMRDMRNDIEKICPIQVDHVLRDDNYLIELPKDLHDKKTRSLDKMIPFQTSVNRDLWNVKDYWSKRFNDINDNQHECNVCLENNNSKHNGSTWEPDDRGLHDSGLCLNDDEVEDVNVSKDAYEPDDLTEPLGLLISQSSGNCDRSSDATYTLDSETENSEDSED